MKKLNILLLSALALGTTLTSCSKSDSSSTPSTSSLIVGNWKYDTAMKTTSGTAGTAQPYNDPSCTANINYLNISTAGILKEGVLGATTQGGDPCTFTEYPGTWTLNNNVLHIAETGYTADYTIVSVTSTLMTVKIFPTAGDTTTFYTVTLKK